MNGWRLEWVEELLPDQYDELVSIVNELKE